MEPENSRLTDEIAALRAEVERMNQHRFVRQLNSPSWLIGAQVVRGMAFGFGTVLGATLLVSVFAFILSQVDFIPILGNWAARIAEEIRQPK